MFKHSFHTSSVALHCLCMEELFLHSITLFGDLKWHVDTVGLDRRLYGFPVISTFGYLQLFGILCLLKADTDVLRQNFIW